VSAGGFLQLFRRFLHPQACLFQALSGSYAGRITVTAACLHTQPQWLDDVFHVSGNTVCTFSTQQGSHAVFQAAEKEIPDG
jgi:hypothetical protein